MNFTRKQELRIDDVMRKVEALIIYLAPPHHDPANESYPSVAMAGELADMIAGFLTDRGRKVFFPVHITDGDHEEISDIWK